MLIVQHIWSRWTKAARGAASANPRPMLDPAYALKTPSRGGTGGAWVHEVRALEAEEFALIERGDWLTPDDWAHRPPLHSANLRWRAGRDEATLDLLPPWDSMRRTKWPGWLPSPLAVLAPGDVVRIDWNARFAASAGGSNRAYFYEQHCYLLALAEAADKRLFLDAEPRKHIDLRTRIY